MTTELVEVQKIRKEVEPVVQQAADLVVGDRASYEWAAGFLKTIKAAEKRVQIFFGPMKKKAHEAWKEVTAGEKQVMAPLTEAERAVKKKMLVYSEEEERVRRQEQARLQAEADEKARRERERKEKEAARLKTPELKEQRLAEAAAIEAPAVEVASTVPDVAGQSVRKTWKAKIVDPCKAVGAVVAFPDWQAYIKLNEGEFNRFAARTKGKVPLAGVEFYEEATLASGAK